MEGLGEFLRSGREKAGISLDDLAQRTRIRVENLESLEREDFDNLPSDAYVRGFVRQICREVGLPPNDGLVRYDMLRAQSAPPDEITWAEERIEETHGRLERALEDPERVVRIAQKGGRWAGALALAAVVAIVGVLTWRALDGRPAAGDRAAVNPAASPSREVPPGEPETQSAVPHGPPSDPGVRDPSLARSEPSASRPEPSPPIAERTPVPAGMTRAALDSGTGALPDPLGAQMPSQRPRPVAPEPNAAPAPTPPAAASSAVVLELRASRTVDVTVLLDGKGAERHARLEAGERRHWKASDHFVLTASDGGALRVFLNGSDLGPAGEDGRPTMRTIAAPRR